MPGADVTRDHDALSSPVMSPPVMSSPVMSSPAMTPPAMTPPAKQTEHPAHPATSPVTPRFPDETSLIQPVSLDTCSNAAVSPALSNTQHSQAVNSRGTQSANEICIDSKVCAVQSAERILHELGNITPSSLGSDIAKNADEANEADTDDEIDVSDSRPRLVQTNSERVLENKKERVRNLRIALMGEDAVNRNPSVSSDGALLKGRYESEVFGGTHQVSSRAGLRVLSVTMSYSGQGAGHDDSIRASRRLLLHSHRRNKNTASFMRHVRKAYLGGDMSDQTDLPPSASDSSLSSAPPLCNTPPQAARKSSRSVASARPHELRATASDATASRWRGARRR